MYSTAASTSFFSLRSPAGREGKGKGGGGRNSLGAKRPAVLGAEAFKFPHLSIISLRIRYLHSVNRISIFQDLSAHGLTTAAAPARVDLSRSSRRYADSYPFHEILLADCAGLLGVLASPLSCSFFSFHTRSLTLNPSRPAHLVPRIVGPHC